MLLISTKNPRFPPKITSPAWQTPRETDWLSNSPVCQNVEGKCDKLIPTHLLRPDYAQVGRIWLDDTFEGDILSETSYRHVVPSGEAHQRLV